MPSLRPFVVPVALTALGVAALGPSLGLGATSPDRFMGEVHADLTTEQGTRVAAISGSVGRSGLGWGDVVPLYGARSVGMKRPQRVRLYAMNDTTVLAIGADGTTRLRFSDRGNGEMTDGYGTLGTSPKHRVSVNGRGFWDQQPFVPRRGQKIVVVGTVKGALRTALGKRYTLVNYSGSKYSRTALMNNPSRYRQVGGMVVGTGVSASRLAKLDLARSLHNDGRLVATTTRNGMLDRHMYVVSHSHTGQGGVILRREAPRLGYAVHSYPQIREPIFTNSRVGAAKAKSEAATYTPAVRTSALNAALKSLDTALARAEHLAPLPKPKKAKKGKKKTEMQTTASDPATVTAGSDDAAFYTVPVNQYISAAVTAPSVYNAPSVQTQNWTTGYPQQNISVSNYFGLAGQPPASGVATALVPTGPVGPMKKPGDALVYPAAPTGVSNCVAGSYAQYDTRPDWTMDPVPTPSAVGGQWFCAPTPSADIWGQCTVQGVGGGPAVPPPWGMPTDGLYLGDYATLDPVASNYSAAGYRPQSNPPAPAEVLWSCTGSQSPTLRTATITQTVGITYNPIYTVSLAQSTSEVTTQAITETNAAQFNALATASTPMAMGAYATGTGMATAAPSASTAQPESAFGLALAYHSVSLDCSACSGTSGGAVTPAFNSNASSPTQQVTQVQASSSTGTSTEVTAGSNWSTSTSNESGWSVSGNLGAFGGEGTGGVGGGYSQSTTNTSSSGGSISASQGTSLTSSANFTSSNWTTTPTQGKNQAAYVTYSSTVTGAGGSAANAANSLPFPSALMGTGNNTGYIATPSQYGGSGPGPQCLPGAACGPTVITPQPAGSNENLTGFTQGSTSFFGLDANNNQNATGSASPWVNDTFYLLDQGGPLYQPAGQSLDTQSNIGAYMELQVLGQSQISVYEPNAAGSGSDATAITSLTGSSGAAGITTYYNAQGQVVNGGNGATYQTTGLDLCAPPVLTPALWTAGCDSDPNFSGPPAVYQAAPPAITTSSTTNPIQHNGTTGQAEVAAPAPSLTCNPGNWSGNPTFTYQWQQWNTAFGDWQDISGATGTTYTPPQSLSTSTYFTCDVTATNSMGPVSEPAASVEVIVG